MKHFLLTIGVSLASTFVMALSLGPRLESVTPVIEEPFRPMALEVITPKIEAPELEIVIKDHNKFLDDIGFRESSNNYHAVNQFGYLGKYQFDKRIR